MFTVVDSRTLASVASGGLTRNSTTRVLANVVVHGKSESGDDVDSQGFLLPIDVCKGCLVSFPIGSTDPMQPTPNCAAPIDSSTTGDRPCVVGQDQVADCRLCQGDPVCTP
jgi:hypothetical protein